MSYFPISPYKYRRWNTREIYLGNPAQGGIIIGGDHPIVIQSMLNTNPMDVQACVQQTLELIQAGCQVVRLAVPTVAAAQTLRLIASELRTRGCYVPLVADVHFKPEAALEAANWVECIRINPGNYTDRKKSINHIYTEQEFQAELKRAHEAFEPLVLLCKSKGKAIRIGVNHGSLSTRIVNRYGNTPTGMVESALEFLEVCRRLDFHNLKFSLKASNLRIMIQAYRLLVQRLNQLGPDAHYPIHLGVTEAGNSIEGRIKSAIGIGSLLCDGLGDTIRVSLAEPPVAEIPVCKQILEVVNLLKAKPIELPPDVNPFEWPVDPFQYARRPTIEVPLRNNLTCGGLNPIRVVVTQAQMSQLHNQPVDPANQPEAILEELPLQEVDPREPINIPKEDAIITVKDGVDLPIIPAFRLLALRLKKQGLKCPILLKDVLNPHFSFPSLDHAALFSGIALGALLVDGIGDLILVRSFPDPAQALKLAYTILQCAGCRFFKAEYIICPSCGRTLFNIQDVAEKIKAYTQHLSGVKIAIMGCVVNGPGEMADADFGYVGGAPGRVNLYVGQTPVKFNIPEEEAVNHLIELIKAYGRWRDPQ